MAARRYILLLGTITLISLTFTFLLPTNLTPPKPRNLKNLSLLPNQLKSEIKEHAPGNFFKPATHKPPPPSNSTASSEGWFSSWKWLNPFSSNIAKSEERSALPPLQKRCPVYTFFDGEKGEEEDGVLLAWRRAFWAQGFKPLVLGRAEAEEHGLYRIVQGKFGEEFEKEVMRWLAWGRVGTGGVLVDHRIIPMAPRDDYSLTALRRCDFDGVTRYEGWGNRLFAGDKSSIDIFLKHITDTATKDTTSIEEISKTAPEGLIRIEPLPRSFADYTARVVADRWPDLNSSHLPTLINSHLHETFLATYNASITLLTPQAIELQPAYTAIKTLADRLAFCPPRNPIPGSCPSNRPCGYCKKPNVTEKPFLSQDPSTFLLAAVPHPYTYYALMDTTFSMSENTQRSIRFVRTQTRERDAWLHKATTPPLKAGVGAGTRVLAVKEVIAAPTRANFSSLWTSAEDPIGEEEIPWVFGFTLASAEELKVEKATGDERRNVVFQKTVGEVLGGKKKAGRVRQDNENIARIRWAVEAWNLGSAEAWKFTGAFVGRMVQERKEWSAGEKEFGRGLSGEEKIGE
ncbi:hypothetical protein L873DRAFT_1735535 [Choiromyces venosus 120613-1]|uniref:Uncharacterized protein n=1 Tax=Choiromyces venosus 120613-1 TaxID=1336337 RepID=A0A3N4JS31_9PEZI|nr:hypothetical protein L873DRAFT_1735535 [Choiromyces venosus 120613-1]